MLTEDFQVMANVVPGISFLHFLKYWFQQKPICAGGNLIIDTINLQNAGSALTYHLAILNSWAR